MIIDQNTIKDLSIWSPLNDQNLFDLLNQTNTSAGAQQLKHLFTNLPDSFDAIVEQQSTIRYLCSQPLPLDGISNGTLVMLDKFFSEADYSISQTDTWLAKKWLQNLFNREGVFTTTFSFDHIKDFLVGCKRIVEAGRKADVPLSLQQRLEALEEWLDNSLIQEILNLAGKPTLKQQMQLLHRVRRQLKTSYGLMKACYAQLDALQSLAKVTLQLQWHFPIISNHEKAGLRFKKLKHPLLEEAVPYDMDLQSDRHIVLLTGPNMSGKSTFLKALGLASYLAHLGMSVPAQEAEVKYLEALITNMHVEDNLAKGESYFLAEVKRTKQIAEAVVNQTSALVIMDELFKGTNVHDAYACTKAVIEAMLPYQQHFIFLSTHLHELAKDIQLHHSIQFMKFETQVDAQGDFQYTYQLMPGVSNERLGYKILEREGVLDILKQKR
jgi:DNA mismatch repair protein MutS